MRRVPAPGREDLEDREGEWIIAAAETVINPVLTEKRFTHGAAKKAWVILCSMTGPV